MKTEISYKIKHTGVTKEFLQDVKNGKRFFVSSGEKDTYEVGQTVVFYQQDFDSTFEDNPLDFTAKITLMEELCDELYISFDVVKENHLEEIVKKLKENEAETLALKDTEPRVFRDLYEFKASVIRQCIVLIEKYIK